MTITTEPPPLAIICELSVDDVLAAAKRDARRSQALPAVTTALHAGVYLYPLKQSDIDELVRRDLVETARPFITAYPDEADPRLKVADTGLVPLMAALEEARKGRAQARAQRERHGVLVRTHGRPDQVQRWAADLLPPTELLDILRTVFFEDFQYPRFVRLESGDVRHKAGCGASLVTYGTASPNVLEAAEFEQYTRLDHAATERADALSAAIGSPVTSHLELHEHVARCASCNGRHSRRSVSLALAWEGLSVGREYAIP